LAVTHPHPISRVHAPIFRSRSEIRCCLSNRSLRPSDSPVAISNRSFGRVRATRSVSTFASGVSHAADAISPMPVWHTRALRRLHSAGAFRNPVVLAAPFAMLLTQAHADTGTPTDRMRFGLEPCRLEVADDDQKARPRCQIGGGFKRFPAQHFFPRVKKRPCAAARARRRNACFRPLPRTKS
jgi:hypothetical protein